MKRYTHARVVFDEVHHGGLAEKHVVHFTNAHLAFFLGKLCLIIHCIAYSFHGMAFGEIDESGNGVNPKHICELRFFIHSDDDKNELGRIHL